MNEVYTDLEQEAQANKTPTLEQIVKGFIEALHKGGFA